MRNGVRPIRVPADIANGASKAVDRIAPGPAAEVVAARTKIIGNSMRVRPWQARSARRTALSNNPLACRQAKRNVTPTRVSKSWTVAAIFCVLFTGVSTVQIASEIEVKVKALSLSAGTMSGDSRSGTPIASTFHGASIASTL